MSEGLEDKFNQVAARVSSGEIGNLSQDEQLGLYGLYSIVRKGPAPEESPSPLFDLRGYAKWKAWREHSHLSREDAILKYIELVQSLPSTEQKGREKKSRDELGNKASTGFDISFDGETAEQNPDLCYWAATGDVGAVLNCLEKMKISPNYRDQDNLTPLMRAADRDEKQIVDILVSAGADLNAVDNDGQSALHYAVYCEHVEMAALLVDYGASLEIRDGDGLTPAQSASRSVTAAIETVKTGTWIRTSTRFKREKRWVSFIPTLSVSSYRTLIAVVVAFFAVILAMCYRNT